MNTSGNFRSLRIFAVEPRCPSAPFKIWGIISLSKFGTMSLNSQRSRWIARLMNDENNDANAHRHWGLHSFPCQLV